MKTKMLLIAALAAIPFLTPGTAEARDRYCREYTKSVRIGGDLQSAYGTACMQPDGSWEMVNFGGHDGLFDDIAQDAYRGNGGRVIYVDRPANYWYRPFPRPHHYRPFLYNRPGTHISFYWGDDDRHDHRHWKKKHHGRDRDWDHDRHRGHHRGRGHDRHDHD